MIYLILLLPFFAFSQEFSPVINPNKFTVCAITINSDDEKKVFETQMKKNSKKFNPIVELTNFGESNWFQKACESGLRCDQLIISGHFGGEFFGKSEHTLSLKELEAAGCSKTCEGILSQPYEVFLFGCNTLSEKEQDHRTPAQYLQVLLNDGISPVQAEMVVESRYGALGDTHKASMRRAFKGMSKQLYGFDSVGPSGKNIKKLLENYFAKTSLFTQLQKVQAQRMINFSNMLNHKLSNSLKDTAFTQCSTGAVNDEASKLICGLQDSKTPRDKKFELVIEALSRNDYLTFIPAINIFSKNVSFESLNPEEQKIYNLIRNNSVIKDQILGLLSKAKSLTMKVEWSSFALAFGIINKDEVEKSLSELVRDQLSAGLSRREVDVICSIDYRDKSLIKLNKEDILKFPKSALNLEALFCLDQPTEIFTLLVDMVTTLNVDETRDLLDDMASSLNGNDDFRFTSKQVSYLGYFLNSKDTDLQKTVKDLFIRCAPDTEEATQILKEMFNSEVVDKSSILELLERKQIKEPSDLDKIVSYIEDPFVGPRANRILINAKHSSPRLQSIMSDYLDDNKRRDYALDYFKAVPPSDKITIDKLFNMVDIGDANARRAMEILTNTSDHPINFKKRIFGCFKNNENLINQVVEYFMAHPEVSTSLAEEIFDLKRGFNRYRILSSIKVEDSEIRKKIDEELKPLGNDH